MLINEFNPLNPHLYFVKLTMQRFKENASVSAQNIAGNQEEFTFDDLQSARRFIDLYNRIRGAKNPLRRVEGIYHVGYKQYTVRLNSNKSSLLAEDFYSKLQEIQDRINVLQNSFFMYPFYWIKELFYDMAGWNMGSLIEKSASFQQASDVILKIQNNQPLTTEDLNNVVLKDFFDSYLGTTTADPIYNVPPINEPKYNLVMTNWLNEGLGHLSQKSFGSYRFDNSDKKPRIVLSGNEGYSLVLILTEIDSDFIIIPPDSQDVINSLSPITTALKGQNINTNITTEKIESFIIGDTQASKNSHRKAPYFKVIINICDELSNRAFEQLFDGSKSQVITSLCPVPPTYSDPQSKRCIDYLQSVLPNIMKTKRDIDPLNMGSLTTIPQEQKPPPVEARFEDNGKKLLIFVGYYDDHKTIIDKFHELGISSKVDGVKNLNGANDPKPKIKYDQFIGVSLESSALTSFMEKVNAWQLKDTDSSQSEATATQATYH
jgi:hypothetical protein